MKKLIDKQVFKPVPNPKLLLFILFFIIFKNGYSQLLGVSSPSNGITQCKGETVNFLATEIYPAPHNGCTGGSHFKRRESITFIWRVNGTVQSSQTNTMSTNNLSEGSNYITCEASEQYTCYTTFSPPGSGGQIDTITFLAPANTYGQAPIYINVYQNQTNLAITGPANPIVINRDAVYSVPTPPVGTAALSYVWDVPTEIGTYTPGVGGSSITIHAASAQTLPLSYNISVSANPSACSVTDYPLAVKTSAPFLINTLDTPPTNPTGLTASAATSNVNTSINLGWTASTDNVVVQSYQVYYKNTTSATDQTWHSEIVTSPVTTPVTAAPTSVILTNLSEGKYQIYLVAIDNNGLLSGSGNTIEYILDHTAPTSPSPLTSLEQTDFSLTLSWKQSTDAVGVKGYYLYEGTSTTPIGPAITSTTTYPVDITNLAVPIVFRVEAFDESGNTSSATYTLLTKVKPINVDHTNGYVGIGVNPPSERLDVDGNLKVRGNLNVLGDFYQNGNKLTLDSWIGGGFQDPSGNWWGQLQNQWKQKLILAADVTELWGTMSAWAGVSVGGRNKWIAGGPDLINGLPWYGIGLIDGNRGPANGFDNGFNPVQVAGYFGIIMIDNTYNASTRNVALKIQNGRVGIGLPQNQNLTQALVVNGTVKATGLELPDGVINSIQNLGSWSKSGTTDIYRGAGNVGIGVVDPQERLHILNGNIKVEAGSLSVQGSVTIDAQTVPNGQSGACKDVPVASYISTLNFGSSAVAGTDPLYISRYNVACNVSELRVNIGDDFGSNDDKFVVGVTNWADGQWHPLLSVGADGFTRIAGKVLSRDLKVVGSPLTATFPDYVFDKSYKLTSLSDLEKYIEANHHLPEVPSAKEIEKEDGFEVGKMNILLLKKVEELTLYTIEQDKKNRQLQERLEKLEKKKNK